MIISGESRHRFITSDTGTKSILEMDENGSITWSIPTAGNVFDLWMLPDNTILYCHYGRGCDGVSIVDRQGGVLFRYTCQDEVFGCQPLENGNILLGELKTKLMKEINRKGEVIQEIPLTADCGQHEVMRAIRRTKFGNYVVSPGTKTIRKYDGAGRILKEYATHPHTFGMVQKDNGNIIYSHMEGLTEINEEGIEVWTLRTEDVPEIQIKWILGFQLLPNGNLVAANWLGHSQNEMGVPIFEVSPDKKIVWSCDCRYITREPCTLMLLDDDIRRTCYVPCR